MKKLSAFASIFVVVLSLFLQNQSYSQNNFKWTNLKVSKGNDKKLKQHLLAYQAFEISASEIRNYLRKNNSNKKKAAELSIELNGEIIKFNLFENDIFDDTYQEIREGKKVTKDKIEINTYAGYVGDESKNVLRLFISDNRISGFFTYKDEEYLIGHLSDYGISEKGNKHEVYVTKAADEISKIEGMTCANGKPSKNGRTEAGACPDYVGTCPTFPACKYVKLAITSDNEFYANYKNIPYDSIPAGINLSSSQPEDIIIDFINRIDLIMMRDLKLRIKLIQPPLCYKTSPDPFPDNPTNNIEIALQEYVKYSLSSNPDVINYFLTGKSFGYIGASRYGQSNQCSICGYNSKQVAAISTITKITGGIINYTDIYRTIAHEMGHVLGADHDCSSLGVMCDLPNKQNYFGTIAKKEINCYLSSQGSCLNNNTIVSAFSNYFVLKLNGNNTSTPTIINQSPKILSIADNPPYTLLSSSFLANDSRVFFHYKNLKDTKFEIKTAPNFTMAVNASDQCSFYQSNVLFVYASYGARIGTNAYPNPTSQEISLEDIKIENDDIQAEPINLIKIQSEQGSLVKEILVEPSKSKVVISTKELKNGIYYLQIIRKDGSLETKRIRIEH